MKIHARHHEVGPSDPRMRVWSDEMDRYGAFTIVNFDVLQAAKDAADKLDIGLVVIVHHCQMRDECDCQPLPVGAPVPAD